MAQSLLWSAPPERVAQQLLTGQSVGFAVKYRRTLRWRRVDFALTSLRDMTLMTGSFDPFQDVIADGWLVWQSVTGMAAVSALPCDAAALCHRLGLGRVTPDAAAAATALTAVVEAAYRQGGLLD